MSISARGLAAIAAVLVLAIIGAGWIGRSTAGVVTQPSTSPSSSPAAITGVTFAQYRDARNAICMPLNAQLIALNEAGASFHPDTNPADVPATIVNLQRIVAIGTTEVQQLGSIQAPADMAAEHAADVTRHSDSTALLSEAITKLQAGDVAAADGLTNATEPLSRLEESYEAKYGLAGCP